MMRPPQCNAMAIAYSKVRKSHAISVVGSQCLCIQRGHRSTCPFSVGTGNLCSQHYPYGTHIHNESHSRLYICNATVSWECVINLHSQSSPSAHSNRWMDGRTVRTGGAPAAATAAADRWHTRLFGLMLRLSALHLKCCCMRMRTNMSVSVRAVGRWWPVNDKTFQQAYFGACLCT